MSVTVKRTFIRPKGREEYESKGMSTSQQVAVVGQQIVAQGGGEKYSAGNGIEIKNGVISVTQKPVVYSAGKNIAIANNAISSPESVQSKTVAKIVTMKTSDYYATPTHDEDTLYFLYTPTPQSLSCTFEQVNDVESGGTTLSVGMITHYMSPTALLHYNDGSVEDVTSACTWQFAGTTLYYDISANTQAVRVMCLRPLIQTIFQYSGGTPSQFTAGDYVEFWQAASAMTVLSEYITNEWVSDIPAAGGQITQDNYSNYFTVKRWYNWSDGTTTLQEINPASYYPFSFTYEPNTTGNRREMSSFSFYARQTVGQSPNQPMTWITPYQAG